MKRKKSQRRVLPVLISVLLLLIAVLTGCLLILSRKSDSGRETAPNQETGEENLQKNFEENSEENFKENSEEDSTDVSVSEPNPKETARKEKVEELLNSMCLEEKVGQMFIARCPGEQAKEKAKTYHLGGYLLFARDFEGQTPKSIQAVISGYQSVSGIPMLIGVDEEGGIVNRVSRYSAFRDTLFQSPQELYKLGGFERIASDTAEKCELLKSLGINVNFAPVCDVSTNSEDYIYERTFGKGAEETADYIETVIKVMKEESLGSVLKHFPGYGNNADTHTGIAYDNRPLETFETSDFLPFLAGIQSGADMVLVSHNIVTAMDDKNPSSLSPAVHRILREELGFTGVIITDDLAMDGIRNFADEAEAAVLAVEAGNDLLCSTSFETQIPAVLKAVQDGRISRERIDESVRRILEMKERFGLF